MPKRIIEVGEEIAFGMKREMKVETGIDIEINGMDFAEPKEINQRENKMKQTNRTK